MNELILIVDDEPGILSTLAQILEDEGFRTVTADNGAIAVELFSLHRPDVVFLDIWLPDRDGLETLQELKEVDPAASVIMMSGHGTAPTAVKSIKMGAFDYLEKPLSYDATVDAVRRALEDRSRRRSEGAGAVLERERYHDAASLEIEPPPKLSIVEVTDIPQRTIAASSVIYGLGLHSGSRTGMILQPLPPSSGIHFVTLPSGTLIPGHISSAANTEYATSLAHDGETIRTVEHLLSALHAFGITNLLIKVHGEIPVLDGSALGFCQKLHEIGIVNQNAAREELVIDQTYRVGDGDETLTIEPSADFSVSYYLDYPAPIGEQFFEFVLTDPQAYQDHVAPARTFGFMRDLKMINELGLGSGGRLDNFILVGEDNVINTELRFPDEFVRHKVLDIIGDLYLLGFPVRGKVAARLTGHRHNIALQRAIREANG